MDILNTHKNKEIVATWEDSFQLSLINRSDPIDIIQLSGFGYHTVPQIGVYGEDYSVCSLFVLIQIPFDKKKFSEDIQFSKLKEFIFEYDTQETEFYFLCHSMPIPSECQKFMCTNVNEVNLVYHPWLFRNELIDETYCHSYTFKAGVFNYYGIRPVHQDLVDGGIPFDEMDERTACIHSMLFSPENCQFQVEYENEIAFFFSYCVFNERSVLCFHVIPLNEEKENQLRKLSSQSNYVGQLIEELKVFQYQVGNMMEKLVLEK